MGLLLREGDRWGVGKIIETIYLRRAEEIVNFILFSALMSCLLCVVL